MKCFLLNFLFLVFFIGFVHSTKRISRHHRLPSEEQGEHGIGTTEISSLSHQPQNSKGESSKVCEGWWCGHGKECQVGSHGMPECSCISSCPHGPTGSQLCGSDGQLYPSRCELHRRSCLANLVITVDRLGVSCRQSPSGDNAPPQSHFYATYEKELIPESKNDESWKRRKGDEGDSANQKSETVRTPPIGPTGPTDDGEWTFPKFDIPGHGPVTSEEEDDAEDEDEDGDNSEDVNGSKEGSSLEGLDPPPPTCSPQEYEILKDRLLLYSHERLIGGVQNLKKTLEGEGTGKVDGKKRQKVKSKVKYWDTGEGPEGGKDYLLSLMFSHFDQNNNGALEYEELKEVGEDRHLAFNSANSPCALVSLLDYDDVDRNHQLNINEFYTAFNKLYSVSVISLDKALEVTHVRATVGDNVEFKCDISGSPPIPILWKRYGFDLSSLNQEEQIRVFSDGTLFLNKIQLLHAGNYTCQAQRNDKVVQTHVLTVQTLPDVKVTPHIVWEKPGEEVTMECRVMGEPFPTVRWLKNDDPLPTELGDKYVVTGDGIRLRLNDIYFSDTGAYMCMAENSAGKRLDISSLVVIDDTTPTVGGNESQFFVFHSLGISVYDPANCRIQHQIQATDVIPGTQDSVCGEQDGICNWGGAVKVSSTYVYVTQPKLDRVLVISVSQMVVVDVVSTDRYPVGLDYVEHLDQIWVQCWRSPEPNSQKTLQVIRDAKERRKHHTVHPEPINSHFDLVEGIFLPPNLKSSSQFRYGYVSHKNTRGLYKMDLTGLRYTKSIDLTPYNCFPRHLQFSALYGMIIIECYEPVTLKHSGQLVLDAMTDAVVHFKSDRYGRPYLSPDSRKLVTVSHGPDGTTLLLQLVKETGLEFFFDVKTSLNVSDISFFPSQRSHTYDLYASAVDKEDVLFLDLESGKVEMVSGVGGALEWSPWKSTLRPISSQGLFSLYLATPSADAVFVLNGLTHTVNCQIGGLSTPHQIVWL